MNCVVFLFNYANSTVLRANVCLEEMEVKSLPCVVMINMLSCGFKINVRLNTFYFKERYKVTTNTLKSFTAIYKALYMAHVCQKAQICSKSDNYHYLYYTLISDAISVNQTHTLSINHVSRYCTGLPPCPESRLVPLGPGRDSGYPQP